MSAEQHHSGAQLYTPGQHETIVENGVVVGDAANRILTRGLTVMQVQAARVQNGEIYTVQGTDWTDEDAAALGLSDAERWVDIQQITSAALGTTAVPAPNGKINWTDHYCWIRVVATTPGTTAHMKFNSLGSL